MRSWASLYFAGDREPWKVEEYQSVVHLMQFLLHFLFHTNMHDVLKSKNEEREAGKELVTSLLLSR